MFHKGLLIVVSAPSGTGKGTLLRRLRELDSNIRFSISATTREPRQGEVDGRDYFFRTEEEFMDMVEKDQLIEWVKYCDHYYGTPRKFVEETMDQGLDVVLEIDVEGAMRIKNLFPGCVMIFIIPPSMEELRKRITMRGTEDTGVIEKRIQAAKRELTFAVQYEYIVVNDNLDEAASEMDSILKAEKLKFIRNSGLVNTLL